MHNFLFYTVALSVLHFVLVVAVILRVLLRPHREPASRIAWIVVVLSVPILGVVAYALLGENDISDPLGPAPGNAEPNIEPLIAQIRKIHHL